MTIMMELLTGSNGSYQNTLAAAKLANAYVLPMVQTNTTGTNTTILVSSNVANISGWTNAVITTPTISGNVIIGGMNAVIPGNTSLGYFIGVGQNGLIYRYNSNLSSYTSISSPTTANLNYVTTDLAGNFVAVSNWTNTMIYSSDGGNTWNNSNLSIAIGSSYTTSGNFNYVGYQNGTFYALWWSGSYTYLVHAIPSYIAASWTGTSISDNYQYYGYLHNMSGSTYINDILVGVNSRILLSNNGAYSGWALASNTLYVPTGKTLRFIVQDGYYGATALLAGGSGGTLVSSVNYGNTWYNQSNASGPIGTETLTWAAWSNSYNSLYSYPLGAYTAMISNTGNIYYVWGLSSYPNMYSGNNNLQNTSTSYGISTARDSYFGPSHTNSSAQSAVSFIASINNNSISNGNGAVFVCTSNSVITYTNSMNYANSSYGGANTNSATRTSVPNTSIANTIIPYAGFWNYYRGGYTVFAAAQNFPLIVYNSSDGYNWTYNNTAANSVIDVNQGLYTNSIYYVPNYKNGSLSPEIYSYFKYDTDGYVVVAFGINISANGGGGTAQGYALYSPDANTWNYVNTKSSTALTIFPNQYNTGNGNVLTSVAFDRYHNKWIAATYDGYIWKSPNGFINSTSSSWANNYQIVDSGSNNALIYDVKSFRGVNFVLGSVYYSTSNTTTGKIYVNTDGFTSNNFTSTCTMLGGTYPLNMVINTDVEPPLFVVYCSNGGFLTSNNYGNTWNVVANSSSLAPTNGFTSGSNSAYTLNYTNGYYYILGSANTANGYNSLIWTSNNLLVWSSGNFVGNTITGFANVKYIPCPFTPG